MKQKVAVIGGGIAGLTFARCLSTNQYEVHIFEQKQEFGEVGAAISVFPNALSVMDEIGLLDPILKTSGKFENVYLKTKKGNILSKSSPKSDYPVVCIHRADLHRILLTGINAQLHKGKSVKQLANLDNGQVEVTFENGECSNFDAVIGADGIHSVVRKHIIKDGDPIYRGYNVWRGVVETNFDIGYASETYGEGQRVGIVPIKDGVYGWWATCNEAFLQDDIPEGTKNKLKRLFGDWHQPIPELMENTEKILKNSLSDRVPHKGWTKGNITLIGDAAHPTTPNLGQGGCMAIEGAYLLAQCVNKYGLSPKAYALYEKHQFPRSKEIVNESLTLGKIGQISNPILIALRNFLFKITPSSVAMKMIAKYFSYRVTELKI
ncbi:FAD-dependent monooxygenase [Cyclobacterium amurskyense]|uniref:FAD-dependent oxidoreductase n=1 Tax=Cyclobacterium amurskyense TaxID=320787 RepID=A0A0H4P9S8_9BACT|nr:FAD-dependent monooxygenase [Cyclobacterium amurskyense]AKP50939.1 FAD-dependent oxidoreductase [Cyclobacterium amurskyense]